jgi:hypothetical protein
MFTFFSWKFILKPQMKKLLLRPEWEQWMRDLTSRFFSWGASKVDLSGRAMRWWMKPSRTLGKI